MKHDVLRSVAHNIAASLASGCGLLIGMYELDVFGEAAQSPDGVITVDFLNGTIVGASPSATLGLAVKKYRDALPRLCASQGVTPAAFAELTAQYFKGRFRGDFVVTVADRSGRRTATDYQGHNGHRLLVLDSDGRRRPSPIKRLI